MNVRELRQRARFLRNNPTKPERILWLRLRSEQLGRKFRRQHVLVPFIADFYCRSAKLVVEVDGGTHDPDRDARRDRLLRRRYEVVVLRFSNEQVFRELDAVVEEIAKWL